MRDDADVETAAVVTLEPSAGPEGFILEEIEMRGFMRYLEKTVPPLRFPEKYTVITGRTGAGKSSSKCGRRWGRRSRGSWPTRRPG